MAAFGINKVNTRCMFLARSWLVNIRWRRRRVMISNVSQKIWILKYGCNNEISYIHYQLIKPGFFIGSANLVAFSCISCQKTALVVVNKDSIKSKYGRHTQKYPRRDVSQPEHKNSVVASRFYLRKNETSKNNCRSNLRIDRSINRRISKWVSGSVSWLIRQGMSLTLFLLEYWEQDPADWGTATGTFSTSARH